MKLLQKFVIQNAKFSKCLLTNRGVSLLKPKSYDYHDYIDAWFYTFFYHPFDHLWFTDTHKTFSENFKPKSYDCHDYIDAWFYTFFYRPFDHSWFFHWGDEIKN